MSSEAHYVLAFACWGGGIYAQEIAYCVATARYWLGKHASQVRIVVYADEVEPFANMPVEVIAVSSQQLREWRGPDDFSFKIKIHVVADVLRRYGKPALYLDSDTYFMKSPLKLFRKLRPGTTYMHCYESVLRDSPDQDYALIPRKMNAAGVTDRLGVLDHFPEDMPSYNAGVIGIHPADASLLDDVLHACDQLYRITGVRTSEQLAFVHVFTKQTHIKQALGVIYHYYTYRLRSAFQPILPGLLAEAAKVPESDRAAWLYARRARCRFRRRVRVHVEFALRRLGFLKSTVLFNSESY